MVTEEDMHHFIMLEGQEDTDQQQQQQHNHILAGARVTFAMPTINVLMRP